MSEGPLPTGTVTFLLTDIEGSTRLWDEHPDAMAAAVERHDAVFGSAVTGRAGVLIRSKGEGDSTFSVFARPLDAVLAAIDAQRALHGEAWPSGIEISVRAALNTGIAELRRGDYFGIEPNRCARLRAVAHGGQTICAQATAELVEGRLPAEVSMRDIGLHRLRDLARAERVFQLSHPDLPGEFPPLRSLGVRHNLPQPRTSFVGRNSELMAVRKYLERERIVTLTGVGGCGKTRLALEAAADQLERFPDGVFFVDLAPVSDARVVAGAVASAVGFSRLALGTGSGRPGDELSDFLSSRTVLLVMDNCEHLVDACAELVDAILTRCPQVSVLATSREALDVEGEQSYPLDPLAVHQGDGPDASDATLLFCERAAAVRPDFVMSQENADDVAEICRRLDGLPLAIELAAAQIIHLSPGQILQRLGDRFRLLTGGRHHAPRQHTLEAVLDWSHDLLGPDERVVLRRLSAFPGSFSLEAAEAVVGDVPALDSLGSLVGKSLVVTEDEGGVLRYRLLETVRMYAEARLVEAGEDASIRERHRDYFLAWAESIPSERTYLDPDGEIRRERHNLHAALSWSVEQGRLDLVGRIAATMNRIWIGDIREGRRWLELGVQAADDLDPDHRVRVLAVAAHVAVLAMQAADGVLARRAVEASGGRPGMWSSLAHALLCLNAGIRFLMTRDESLIEEVERLGRDAVRLAPGPLSRGLAWFWLGQAKVLIADLEGARRDLEKGSAEGIPGGDMSMVSLAMLAGLLHVQGDHGSALAAAEQVLERTRSIHGGGLWAWALYCSLPCALELGARGCHDEALDFVRDLVEEGGVPRTPGVMLSVVIALAGLAAQRGDDETAGILLEFVGSTILREGFRTPVDLVLYTHYVGKVRAMLDASVARACRERGRAMSLEEAIAYGLRVTGGESH